MVTNFESTFTAVVNADDKFMHATKCVVAGWISTFKLDNIDNRDIDHSHIPAMSWRCHQI